MDEVVLYISAPSPCKNCENRSAGCHGSCAAYLAYRAERESEYEERRTNMEMNLYLNERIRRTKAKRHLKR